MGADNIDKKTIVIPTIPQILIGMVALLAVVALISRLALTVENEAPKLKPKEEAKLEKRLKEIDDSEQYALVASVDGFYPCLHSGRTTY